MYKSKFDKWCIKYCWFLLIACIILTGIGLGIVIRLAPRGINLDFDYYGVIVGILSLLVTILIGWNIFSVIDLKRIKEEYNSTILKIQKDNQLIKKGVLLSRGQIEEDFAVICGPEVENRPKVISHAIKAIYIWAETEEFEKANNSVEFLLMVMEQPSLIRCSARERDGWTELLKSVPNQQAIRKIEKIYSLLSKINVE